MFGDITALLAWFWDTWTAVHTRLGVQIGEVQLSGVELISGAAVFGIVLHLIRLMTGDHDTGL